MSDEKRTEGQPHDRLTRLCDAMTQALEAQPEYQKGDKCIIFMDSDAEQRGGLVMHGYNDDSDALTAIFMHMRAIMRANGREMLIAPLHGTPEDN